ncbi:MAG: PHP domain-containing protein [Myxococcota bacterium]|nr:PHP domain-containing protein [Myxococcota bacterium]
MPPPRSAASAGSADSADYVELRCASAFSFLAGASNPEDLAERAVRTGHRALALADQGGLYGIPRFHQAAQAAGLDAIVGARVRVADRPDGTTVGGAVGGAADRPADRTAGGAASGAELLLLVETPRGYRHLSRLLTVAHAKGGKHAPCFVTWNELEEHAGDLVALLRGDASLRVAALDRVHALFGAARCGVDVSRHLDRPLEAAARRAAALAEAHGVTVLASNDVRHAQASDRPLLDVLTCLHEKTSLDGAGRRLAPNAERHLKTPAEMARLFADHPERLRATRAFAERCTFRLGDLGYRFPTFPTPGGVSQQQHLRALTFAGARGRYGHPLRARVRRQLEHELAVIGKLGLAGYFLIVEDIVRFARTRGMLAQGRGSAANSAVCYALGITAVDPVGMELLFERFLSEERGEWPDIDIDLPSGAQRESVIQYVFTRYGPGTNTGAPPAGQSAGLLAGSSPTIGTGAAMTANVITWRTRLAVRELGKVLDLEPDTIHRLAKLLHTLDHREDLDGTQALLRQGGVDPGAPRVRALLALVDRVRGLPRHLGQHSGGVVIAAGRLDDVVPIEPAAMPGRHVLQWDKEDCADLGIIKIDLLGLGMLNALERTIELVRTHEGLAIDLARLPADDAATWAMIQCADTMGTFQIESRAQMATLPRMKPACFYDLVVEIAIIRPGPIVGKLVHPYLARRTGREPVCYPHPSLEPILRRTLGVPLFQEQLLRIAMTAAGFSGGEAEELRRAMGAKRSRERMERLEQRLREGMTARGLDGAAQDDIVRGITSFALYGFPESHAASFAGIAWASAWLKQHHPAAFLAGLLDAWPMGFYAPASLVQDAQRHDVVVRPIDVARSGWRCTLERTRSGDGSGDGSDGRSLAVRLPLRFVRGLREESARRLEQARAERAFAHVADLAQRAALAREELLALAELGALASIDPAARTRRAALWQVSALEQDPRSLFAGTPPNAGSEESATSVASVASVASTDGSTPACAPSAPTSPSAPSSPSGPSGPSSPLPEMSPLEATLADYRASGISTGPHVVAHLRAALRARGVRSAAELRNAPDGCRVRTAGHVIVRQRPGSARGMCFLTLEDETGTSNAVLTPPCYRRFRATLHTALLVEIAGRLENRDGVVHLRVEEMTPLGVGTEQADRVADSRAALPRSYDYR